MNRTILVAVAAFVLGAVFHMVHMAGPMARLNQKAEKRSDAVTSISKRLKEEQDAHYRTSQALDIARNEIYCFRGDTRCDANLYGIDVCTSVLPKALTYKQD